MRLNTEPLTEQVKCKIHKLCPFWCPFLLALCTIKYMTKAQKYTIMFDAHQSEKGDKYLTRKKIILSLSHVLNNKL